MLGASGFVGRALVAALGARGDDVRATSLRDPVRAAALADGFSPGERQQLIDVVPLLQRLAARL